MTGRRDDGEATVEAEEHESVEPSSADGDERAGDEFSRWLDSDEGAAAFLAIARNWRSFEEGIATAAGLWHQHHEAIERFAFEAASVMRGVAELAAVAAQWWNEHQSQVAEAIAALSEYPERHRRAVSEYAAICTRLGWPPTMQFPLSFLEAVVARSRGGATDEELSAELTTAWEQYFDAHQIEEIAREWWEWPEVLGSRRPILESALGAHHRGDYALSVPVFLSQMEGVLVDTFAHRGPLSGHGVKPINGPGGPRPSFLGLLVDGSDPLLGYTTVLVYAKEVTFSKFTHGDPVQVLKRHAVLHGADVGYGTRLRSLQAILTFDLIVGTLGLIDLGDGVLHRPGCVELGRVASAPPTSAIRVVRGGKINEAPTGQRCARCHPPAEPRSS